MDINEEKAEVIRKLARKNNWGNKYDRLENFKRFPDLKRVIKDLEKNNWLIIKKKPTFTGISLNPVYKKQIIGFVEKINPNLSEMIE